MSSSDAAKRNVDRRSALNSGLGLAVGAALVSTMAGCAGGDGFRPMYAATSGGPQLQEKLASVEVATIPSRVGQRIRNELIFQSTGGGGSAPPVYRLDVAIRETVVPTLVRSTGEAASNIYTLDASFSLIDMRSKKVILKGVSYARAGFDRFPSIYSNVRAREDAENRAANVIAEDVKSRVAAFLSNNKV